MAIVQSDTTNQQAQRRDIRNGTIRRRSIDRTNHGKFEANTNVCNLFSEQSVSRDQSTNAVSTDPHISAVTVWTRHSEDYLFIVFRENYTFNDVIAECDRIGVQYFDVQCHRDLLLVVNKYESRKVFELKWSHCG